MSGSGDYLLEQGSRVIQYGTVTLNSTTTETVPLVEAIPDERCSVNVNNNCIVGRLLDGSGNVTALTLTWINTNTNVKVYYEVTDLRL